MKKIYIISWSILLAGLILRILHLNGAGILMSLSGLLLLIHSLLYLIKHVKSNLPLSVLYLTFASITIYLIARLQYWSFGRSIFIITCLFTLTYFIIYLVYKLRIQAVQIVLIGYLVLFEIISYIPSYTIYYYVNMNTLINKDSRRTDYYSWDKYSWFLYIRDRQKEAIEANINAQEAARLYLKKTHDEEAKLYLEIIKQHEQQIKDKTWTDF